MSISDFCHFTGAHYTNAIKAAKWVCKLNVEYYAPAGDELVKYKRENPKANIKASRVIILNEKGVRKLLKHFRVTGDKIPMLEQKKALPQDQQKQQDTKPVVKQQDKPIITIEAETKDKQITEDDCITALNVLRHIKRNCETNIETAKSEGKNTAPYKKELDECNNVIKGVGMLIVMGC